MECSLSGMVRGGWLLHLRYENNVKYPSPIFSREFSPVWNERAPPSPASQKTGVARNKKVDKFLEWGDIVMISRGLCILSQKLMSPKVILLNCGSGIGGAVYE